MGRRGRKLFLAVVFAEHMEVAALYRQVKLVVLVYASEKSETLVSEGHQLTDNITYYDASVQLKFVGSGTATQHECMLLAELAPLCSDGHWAGRITACLASEALGCIVKFIPPVDKKARVKQDASAVSRGRGRKGSTLVTTAGARRACPPIPTRRCACVRRTVRRTRSNKKRRSPSLSTSSSTGCPLCLN